MVPRRRSGEWVARVLAVPTTVIQAPAGYGKTTLLAQFHAALSRDDRRACWLSIVASDREPESFLAALAASCGLPELPRGESADRSLTRLANWLGEAGEPGCILLDDADRLSESASGGLLHELVDAIPTGFHVICTGRAAPDLPSARERGYGRLFELGAGDLSFSAVEVTELFGVLGIGAPGEAELERFLRRSEGWPMVVRSESVALAAANGAHALDRLTGKRHDIAAFFEAEVLRNERPEMIRVLEAAAIAEQTNGAMATALTGLENAHALLDEACERGLFVTAIDESRQCYRVHRLFSEALRQRLERRSASHERELHRRASEWYENSGSLVEAVDHAVQGGDAARAARIFDTHSEEFMETGHESAILTVANRIPAGLQLRHPRLLLAMSWRLLAEWQFERARNLLARAQARIDEMAAQGDCEPSELGELRHQLLHGQVMLAQFSDDLSFIERHTESLLRSPSDMSAYVRGSLHAALLFAAREQFRLARIDSLEILARQQFQVVSSRYVTIFLEGIIAPGNLMRGRTASVIATLTEALRTALEVGGPTLAPMVALPLAEAHYDRGELEAALTLLDTYLPQAREIGFADQLIAGCTARVRIARLRGERAVALRVLEETIQFARERSFEKLLVMLTAEQIDVLCRFGETAEAGRLAAKVGLRRAADSVMPRPRVTRAKVALAYAWTSLAQAQGRCSEAIKVARKWRNLIEAAGAVRDALRWSVRLVVLLRRAGDEIGARRELHRAIGVAAPMGLMQLLLEETEALGEGLAGELVAALDAGGGGGSERLAEAALTQGPVEAPGALGGTPGTGRSVALGMMRANASGGTPAGSGAGWAAGVGSPPGIRSARSPVAARAGGSNLTASSGGGIAARMPGGSLTPREVEILTLVGEGLSNAEIGHRLSLVEGSVKWHLQRIYDKIGTRRRLVAVDRARRMGVFR